MMECKIPADAIGGENEKKKKEHHEKLQRSESLNYKSFTWK